MPGCVIAPGVPTPSTWPDTPPVASPLPYNVLPSIALQRTGFEKRAPWPTNHDRVGPAAAHRGSSSERAATPRIHMNIELTETKTYSFKVGDTLLEGFVVTSEWNGMTELRRGADKFMVYGLVRGAQHAMGAAFGEIFGDIFGGHRKSGEPLQVGLDFNVNNMTACVNVVREGLPLTLAERVKVRDTPAMARILKEDFKDKGHQVRIYPDASGANTSSKNASESDLSILRQAGFQIEVDYSNPAVKDRVNAYNAMILNADGVRRWKIKTDTCPTTTEALEQQVWGKDGQPCHCYLSSKVHRRRGCVCDVPRRST
jgi:hypothetical protein